MTDNDGKRFAKESPRPTRKSGGDDSVTANPACLAHPCVCVRIYLYCCHAVIDRKVALGLNGLRHDVALSSLIAYRHRCHWPIVGVFAGKQEGHRA